MSPLNEYLMRRDRWEKERKSLEARFIRIGNARLIVALIAVLLAVLAFGRHSISTWSILLPAAVFIALVAWHQSVIRRKTLAQRAISYYERGIARLEDRWIGHGNTGDQFRNDSHVYAGDLDLFGKGSLFELIDSARTRAGEQMLADWLLSPASFPEVLARQDAVKELAAQLDLRESIALLGEDIRSEVHSEGLEIWGAAPPVAFPKLWQPASLILAVLGLAALIGFFSGSVPLWVLLGLLAINFILIFRLRQQVKLVLGSVETPAKDLALFSLILGRLEREQFQTGRLKLLRASLDVHGLVASRRIARLGLWIQLLESSDHVLLRVLGPVILWREQLAMGIEAWRRETGPFVGRWIHAVAEFEALSSLGSLTFERPHWSFPMLEQLATPLFEAQALQHPLLPAARCVPNDVKLNGSLRLFVVSGSNMSGKSTLLRSVGLNTVLAWAGAPVAAAKLMTSMLQTAASMRIVDSLQDNRSRFFAEITRIRQIVDLTRASCPVIFLLDELLSGTNSHDRLIGASGIVHSLLNSGAIGLITTHDLALANIAHDLGSNAENVHFEDQIVDGQIHFDYRLRPGVVSHSNALALMRAVGLDV